MTDTVAHEEPVVPLDGIAIGATVVGAAAAVRLFDPVPTDGWALPLVIAMGALVPPILAAVSGRSPMAPVLAVVSLVPTAALSLATGESRMVLLVGVSIVVVIGFHHVRPSPAGFLLSFPAVAALGVLEGTGGAATALLLGAAGALELLHAPSPTAVAMPEAAPAPVRDFPPRDVPRSTPSLGRTPNRPRQPVDERDAGEWLVLGEPARAADAVSPLAPSSTVFVPANLSERHRLAHLEVAATSRRGYSHAHDDEPRQDDYCVERTADGEFLVAAVADGLGSAPLSHLGAYWAVRLAVADAKARLAHGMSGLDALAIAASTATGMLPHARRSALRADLEAEAISATLVLAVLPIATDEIWACRVGDSDLSLLVGDRWMSVFGHQDDGGATFALPQSPDAAETAHYEFPPGSTAMIATDGVARVIDASPDVVGTAFADALRAPVSELTHQRLVAFSRRGAHDDRTAITIWNGREAGSE